MHLSTYVWLTSPHETVSFAGGESMSVSFSYTPSAQGSSMETEVRGGVNSPERKHLQRGGTGMGSYQ